MTYEEIGRRVTVLRNRRGLSQQELAEAAGLGLSTVAKIEQGHGGRMETFQAIARALDVTTMMFVPRSAAAPDPQDENDARDLALTHLTDAVMLPNGMPLWEVEDDEPNLDRLQHAARSFASNYQENRYDAVAQMAPELIRSAHFHVDQLSGDRQKAALRLRGDLLGITGRYLVQIREHALAFVTLNDALRDASAANDEELWSSVVANLAWVMLRQRRFEAVSRLCEKAADRVEPKISNADAGQYASWGWLMLRAAAASARNNRPTEAREFVAAATAAAARIGQQHQTRVHTTFGPMTVSIQSHEVEMVLGQPNRALQIAEQLPQDPFVAPTALTLSPATWHRYLLERARALAQTEQPAKATELMSGLRRAAPEWLRHQRLARDVMSTLLHARRRPFTEEQQQLADYLRLDA